MEKKKSFNSREDFVTANHEDRFLISAMLKTANYIDNFEDNMTNYDGDTACITIDNNYFSGIELYAINIFKSYVIDYCNHKTQYELIAIDVLVDVTIIKVKV